MKGEAMNNRELKTLVLRYGIKHATRMLAAVTHDTIELCHHQVMAMIQILMMDQNLDVVTWSKINAAMKGMK